MEPEEKFRANLETLREVFVWRSVPWLNNAACREDESKRSWWFRPGNTSVANRQRSKAKLICTRCPVRWQCLAEYIEEPFGIFGGFDERERRKLRNTTHYTKWHNILVLQRRMASIA